MRDMDIRLKSTEDIIKIVKETLDEVGTLSKSSFIRLVLTDPLAAMASVPTISQPTAILEAIIFKDGIFNADALDRVLFMADDNDILLSNFINAAENIAALVNLLDYIAVDVDEAQYESTVSAITSLLPVSYATAIMNEIRKREDELESDDDDEIEE